MWVCCLRDPETFYLEVTTYQLLAHLTTSSGKTETKNIVFLHAAISTWSMWWANKHRVPEFIDKM